MKIEIRQRIDWLLAHNLPPLPVAPAQDSRAFPKIVKGANGVLHCPLDKNLNPIPLYTGKNPSFLGDKIELVNHGNYQEKLPSQYLLKKWFANPENGIGTLGGISYKGGVIVWIDLDRKCFSSDQEFDLAVDYVDARLGVNLVNCLQEKTHSGGRRWGIAVKSAPDFTNFCLEPGGFHAGELLGKGRFTVLAPSLGPSGNFYETLHCPQELGVIERIDFLYPVSAPQEKPKRERKERQPISSGSLAIALENCLSRQAQAVLRGDDPKGDESFSLSNFVKEAYGWENWLNDQRIPFTGSPESLVLEAAASLGHDEDKAARIIKSCKDLSQYQPSCWFSGGDESCWKVIKRLNKQVYAQHYLQTPKPSVKTSTPLKEPQGWDDKDGKKVAVETSTPLTEPIQETARIYGGSKDLKTHELVGFVQNYIAKDLEFDDLRSEILLEGKRLSLGTDCKVWFYRKYGETAGKEDIYDVLLNFAKEKSFNPVKRYLEKVATQPQRVRIDNLATRYFGRSEKIYNRMVEMWLISAIARALDKGTEDYPGCQVDHTLILQSGQGKYKSTFFKVLGGAWFDDSVNDIDSKDSLMIVHSSWIIELSELDRITSKKQAGSIKHWLTKKTDSYRKPYAKEIDPQLPRPCVFCGTVNPTRFLMDDENRRFWVISISEAIDAIDIQRITRERDGIWAAAYYAYHFGGLTPLLTLLFQTKTQASPLWTLLLLMEPKQPWWPTASEAALIAALGEQNKELDAWQDEIENWIQYRPWVSSYEILTELLRIEPGNIKRAEDMRIMKILNSLGWVKETRKEVPDPNTGEKKFRRVRLNPNQGLFSNGKVGKVGKSIDIQASQDYQPHKKDGSRMVKTEATGLPTPKTTLPTSQSQSEQGIYQPYQPTNEVSEKNGGWTEKNGHKLAPEQWVWVAQRGACQLKEPLANGWRVWARDAGGVMASVEPESITHVWEV